MKSKFTILVCFITLIFSFTIIAAPRHFTLSVDEWARPRSGVGIVSFPSLRDLVAVWSTVPEGSMIEIRYPGGDEGSLWASELSDWLVALGIASEHIKLTPGHARVDEIELMIVEPRQ